MSRTAALAYVPAHRAERAVYARNTRPLRGADVVHPRGVCTLTSKSKYSTSNCQIQQIDDVHPKSAMYIGGAQ